MKQLNHEETPLSAQTRQITILCDGITLPTNIGAIFRLADAFGVEQIIFGGLGIDTTSRKVKQSSRSTHKWVKHQINKDLSLEIELLRAEKYRILALEITNSSTPLHAFSCSENDKIALVLGSENHGISPKILRQCDTAWHIPLFGSNSSMNVHNALGIMLYEISRPKK